MLNGQVPSLPPTNGSFSAGAEGRVIAVRRERKGRAAAPAADELCRQKLFIPGICRVRAQISAKRRDVLMEFSKHDVGAVATEDGRSRHRGHLVHLVAIAED